MAERDFRDRAIESPENKIPILPGISSEGVPRGSHA